jgi:hypothetical protein
MSQRVSGYNGKDRDSYQTPAWVTDVLTPYLRAFGAEKIWEPAAGDGQMVTALRKRGFAVIGTDVRDGNDFFKCDRPSPYDGIATNPPYGLAQELLNGRWN